MWNSFRIFCQSLPLFLYAKISIKIISLIALKLSILTFEEELDFFTAPARAQSYLGSRRVFDLGLVTPIEIVASAGLKGPLPCKHQSMRVCHFL
jgi:hypothetical protein